jgi:inner membrane protein
MQEDSKIAVLIWWYTWLVFMAGLFVFAAFKGEYFIFLFVLGLIVSLLGSLPALLVLLFVINPINNINKHWHIKCIRLVVVLLGISVLYGLVASMVMHDDYSHHNIKDDLSVFSVVTLVLFCCTMIGTALLFPKLRQFFEASTIYEYYTSPFEELHETIIPSSSTTKTNTIMEQEITTPQQEPSFYQRNKILLKSIIVGILILVLLIPTAFIQELVREREGRQQQVAEEVSSKWANAQTLSGPFVIVPYLIKTTDAKGKVTTTKSYAHFLPDNLSVNSKVLPEIRYRSIYKIVVYRSENTFSGTITINPTAAKIDPADMLLNEAVVCFGLSDFRGIEENITINWNDTPLTFKGGMFKNDVAATGMQAAIPLTVATLGKPITFSVAVKLKGSEKLYFTPLGGSTTVALQSSWNNPSFDGSFIPDVKTVTNNGFTANWKILNLNRNYPQAWSDGAYNVAESSFGINLLQSTDSYGKTTRSVKYALLFIALTFMLFFFVEIIKGSSIHPLQYILIGLALCIFYTLLLSVSEYLNFNIAYALAAAATVGLITLYTSGVFKQWRIAFAFGLVLSALYGFIFILIQLQDYALLFGSIGLFILLAIVMYYSRKIDWFNTAKVTH